MYFYTAHGLQLTSEISLSGLLAGSGNDVSIRLGEVCANQLQDQSNNRYEDIHVVVDEHRLFVFAKHAGTFLVQDGREIIVDPARRASEAMVGSIILGHVLPLLLYQRGRLVLHASAVAFGSKAVAFVGETGRGKSALATALYTLGHEIMTDDVLSLEVSTGSARAFPAYPELSNLPETLQALSFDPGTFPEAAAIRRKRVFPAGDGFSPESQRLSLLYLLARTSGISRTETLTPRAGLAALDRCSYNPSSSEDSSAHFLQCVSLLKSATMRHLLIRHDPEGIMSVARMIENDVKAHAK